MKAVVIHAAHDLRIETVVDRPLRAGSVGIVVEAGGICGSDLHYFNDGGFGAVRLREPMILGHEVAGRIADIGDGTSGLSVGDRVAVSPSRPCHDCAYCRAGQFNHCLNMRFYGSAMPMPHIQGAFREYLVADASQCHLIAPHVSPQIAAFAEPLSVVLHALNRAGSVRDKSVLITGCGPIGALCLLAVRDAGAREVVVTDVLDPVLEIARALGADSAINVARTPGWSDDYSAGKGHFEVMFEASGNEQAMRAGLEVLRPLSTLVQVGLGGDVSLPQNIIVAKEIEIRGSFRFHAEFGDAVQMINDDRLDLAALLSATYPFREAQAAFTHASDRSRAMKVQLDFTL